jgi:hypothetical protein
MIKKRGDKKQPEVIYLTDVPGYIEQRANRLLGVPSVEAFARLDRGELRGTRAEAELTSLRFFARERACLKQR